VTAAFSPTLEAKRPGQFFEKISRLRLTLSHALRLIAEIEIVTSDLIGPLKNATALKRRRQHGSAAG